MSWARKQPSRTPSDSEEDDDDGQVEIHDDDDDDDGQSQRDFRIPPHDEPEQADEDDWNSDQDEEESDFPYEDHEVEVAQEEEDDDDNKESALSAALSHLAGEVRQWREAESSDAPATSHIAPDEVLSRVDDLVEEQLLAMQTPASSPAFVYPNLASWNNVRFCPRRGLLPRFDEHGEALVKTVTALNHRGSARKYSLLLLMLWEVRRLCLEGSFSTRRDVYYRYPNDFSSQSDVDAVASALTAMLRLPRMHLRILATSKGLVAGSLTFVSAQGTEVTTKWHWCIVSVIEDVILSDSLLRKV